MLQEVGGQMLSGLRVLLVEDTPDVRDVFHLLLRADGAEVRAAASARAALEHAVSWDFDVLLTDLGLPDVAGDHLIKAILAMKNGRPRVIVVTGFGEPLAARARAAGADVVFTKPLEWSALCEELTASQAQPLAA
jgi:CheY-like chemotaxis protein